MGRGLRVSDEEKALIRALSRAKISPAAIVKRVKRSRKAIRNVVATSASSSLSFSIGRPPEMTKTAARVIVRRASTGDFSARELCEYYQVPVSVRRIQQLLQNTKHLE